MSSHIHNFKYWILSVLLLTACGDVVVDNKMGFTGDKSMRCIYHPGSSIYQNCASLKLRNFESELILRAELPERSDMTIQVIPIETYSGNRLILGQSISNQYSGPVYSKYYEDRNPGVYIITIDLDNIPVDGYYRVYVKFKTRKAEIDFIVFKNYCAIPLHMQEIRKKVDDRYRKCQ